MYNIILSIVSFIILTICYFIFTGFGKLPITMETINTNQISIYNSLNFPRLAIYFIILLLVQYYINKAQLKKCHLNQGLVKIVLPWILIFGITILLLNIFPDMLKAFSGTIGLMYIYNNGMYILNNILMDPSDYSKLYANSLEDETASLALSEEISNMINQNKDVLLNQLTPKNFSEIFEMLNPIVRTDIDTSVQKEELLELISTKENIGEFMWYVYTGLFTIFVVYLNLRCVKKQETKETANKEEHQQQQEQQQQSPGLSKQRKFTKEDALTNPPLPK
jgi:hypothetical protein